MTGYAMEQRLVRGRTPEKWLGRSRGPEPCIIGAGCVRVRALVGVCVKRVGREVEQSTEEEKERATFFAHYYHQSDLARHLGGKKRRRRYRDGAAAVVSRYCKYALHPLTPMTASPRNMAS